MILRRAWHAAWIALAVCAGAGCTRAQDHEKAASGTAVLDPTGRLLLTLGGEPYALEFRELAWPVDGEHQLAAKPGADGISFGPIHGETIEPLDGVKLTIRTFDPEHLDLDLAWRSADHELRFVVACAPQLRRIRPAVVIGAPEPGPVKAPGAANADDFVLCVIGSPGSGLAGQRRVADSIAKLQGSEHADQVLVLGDLFLPDGVKARDDRLFVDRFESMYPSAKFPLPFRLVIGAAERRGSDAAIYNYCATSPRLSTDAGVGTQHERTGGVDLDFLFCDSPAAALPITNPIARHTRSLLAQKLSVTRSGWLVGASYHALHGHGDAIDSVSSREFVRVAAPLVAAHPVDIWLSGASRSLELNRDEHGVLHVGCGGGAGPDIARSIEWAGDTLFAATGGGSVWLRFHGDVCEITLRDVDGRPMFVHDETRRRR